MNTFLEEFISNKIKTHVEPSRRGTPRGNPIGIGIIKYQAALISSLTNLNLKTLAKQADNSYGVIRKWHTQANFKECCKNISGEFKVIIDLELLDIFMHLAEDFKYGRFHDHDELFARFKDAGTYNKTIINHLAEKLNHYLYELPNGYVAFYDMSYYLARYSGAPKLLEILDRLQASLREQVIEEVITTLQNPDVSNEERGGVVIKLKRLRA